MDLVLKNLHDTQDLGKKLAHCCSDLQSSCIIYLIGDLGAGIYNDLGIDSANIVASDADACAKKCKDNPNCISFTWCPVDTKCYIYDFLKEPNF